MGDGQELVPGVVGVLIRAAEGVAGGPGRGPADLVRARLRATADGARAVDAIEADPGDARARAGLTDAVGELLAADPAFARYLATTELGRPADPPTVHLRVDPAVTGARARAARRGAAPLVVTLALVVAAALVAVGINLGSRPLLRPGGPDLAHAARTLRDPAQVQHVLPDPRALPGGWQVESGPRSGSGPGTDAPCLLPDACDQQLAYATETIHDPTGHSAQFTVIAFASPEAAGRAFDALLARTGGDDPSAPVPLPPVGDQRAARTHGTDSAEALVRGGTTLLHLRAAGPGTATAMPVLALFTRLLAERAQQAQDGREPDAAAQGAA
ncbi:hypothetical protein ACIOJE_25025 [Kitasatospora sp. NPDC087861]|uniref:hypothetical protein n=1 Tax=Kitasatospora sp. NPDC087861 TaxID=3364070 RepID=UPI00381D25B4